MYGNKEKYLLFPSEKNSRFLFMYIRSLRRFAEITFPRIILLRFRIIILILPSIVSIHKRLLSFSSHFNDCNVNESVKKPNDHHNKFLLFVTFGWDHLEMHFNNISSNNVILQRENDLHNSLNEK